MQRAQINLTVSDKANAGRAAVAAQVLGPAAAEAVTAYRSAVWTSQDDGEAALIFEELRRAVSLDTAAAGQPRNGHISATAYRRDGRSIGKFTIAA